MYDMMVNRRFSEDPFIPPKRESDADEDTLTEKASCFIISQELTGKRYVNFDRIIKHIDAKILKKFVNSVIKKIVVFDGKITEIHFKNGITHKFLY